MLLSLPAEIVISKKEIEHVLETKNPDELKDFIARLEYNGFPVKEQGEQLNFCSSFIAS
jgi:CBS domain containing-hemolysin-like protein